MDEPLLDVVRSVAGVGRSGDGLVLVRVDGGCRATEIMLEPDAMHLGRVGLAAAVLEALQGAYADVEGQLHTALQTLTPEEPVSAATVDAGRREVLRQAEAASAEFDSVRRRLTDMMDQF